jgi:F0F1-type ATP synthase assembly protein I
METPQKENQHKSNDLKKKQVRQDKGMQAYARYSGIALQLGGTLAIGAFIGRKLDQYFGLEKPLLTALFALLATVGGIYMMVRGLIGSNNE